ncbi:MAG: type 4a pilus biogenesis protein PilO [Acidobacteria bacterium]|uniref:Type 4a pilus biogenesis protein PilO n=1 Tax=Candidatus Sulfomarinibacter kjeldsenii TaxID=2885994 RepID=A0A8J6Y4Y1_9BACT|nr:type 4a pilus biogenesis protein PilO [Candidatus Sulfomarinibacter kjeldsenii]MBD3870277.1 type 4a pilus biogenesis protein PilO [Candidatus Sulfomarinibacter kjeldsenii]
MAIDLNSKPWYVAAIVGVVLGIAMFVVMNIYIFKDIGIQIERLETSIDELEREIEKGRAAKADLPRLEEDIRNYEIELDRLRKILPTKRETDNLIKRAKQLTERGRFRLTRFTPGGFEDRDFFIEWPIRVGLDGTYHELGLFFDRLSRMPRIINVTELTINPNKKSDSGFTIHAEFVQRTYIYKEETPEPETEE